MNTSRILRTAVGLLIGLGACPHANARQPELSQTVNIKKDADIGELCLHAYTPCFIEGNPPRAPQNYSAQAVDVIFDNWLAHTAFGWFLDNGVIRVYPRTGSLPLKELLNRRIDIDVVNRRADEALIEVFTKAGIRSGINHNGSAFLGQRYPAITLRAKRISIHEALTRILKHDPPLGLQIYEPSQATSFVDLTVYTFSRIPRGYR